MNNGKRYAYKNKFLKKLITTRTCGIHLFVTLVFLIFFVFHNRDLFQRERRAHNLETDDDVDDEQEYVPTSSAQPFSYSDEPGIECAYNFHIDRKFKMWQNTNIVIQLDRFSNCTRERAMSWDSTTSVFRVHAYSSHEMVTTTATYAGDDRSYKAQIVLTFPVRYTVMVLLVYANGLHTAADDTRPVLRQLPGSPFHVNVHKDNSINQSTRYCSRTESGNVAGRWVRCGGALPGLERCGAWLSSDFDLDGIHGFRWVPYSCQYHQYTNDQVRECFARNNWDSIVLSGGSHMKYRTFHWVTRFHGNCHACKKNSPRFVFDHRVPRIEWIFDAYGTRLPHTFLNQTLDVEKLMDPKRIRNSPKTFDTEALQAKLYILNFGRSVLRETTDVMLMNIKLHSYGKAAQMLQRMGKVVVWLSAGSGSWSHPLHRGHTVPPFRIKHFNTIAGRVMRHYKIPVVDAFDIADGRIQAVHGRSTQYVKRLPGNDYGGVVENTITNCIMNLLCNY